jgi:hypothetical protein
MEEPEKRKEESPFLISYTYVSSLKKEKEEKKYHSWDGKSPWRRRSNKLSFLGVLRINEIVSGHEPCEIKNES